MTRFVTVAALVSVASVAHAQDRVPFTFQVSQTTVVGQSVFVLGSLPELGSNDVRNAVKLEPSSYPVWKSTLSLPAGRSFTYQYYIRSDAPGQGGNATNGTPVGSVIIGQTTGTAQSKLRLVVTDTTLTGPVLYWREAGTTGAYTATPMVRIGPGQVFSASGVTTRFAAWDFAAAIAGRDVEFYIATSTGASRDPASGVYSTMASGRTAAGASLFVANSNAYAYVPAAGVTDWRRDYTTSALPSIVAPELNNETRYYRVILPRGYDQHTTRRYPVIYLHDGQNVFEAGAFGTWNAHITAGDLTRLGQMRECILVGIDNGPNRISDYAAPESGGNAANYIAFIRNRLKPRIDATYRTLTGPGDTGAIGSSMGGQVSLFMGWDYASTFGRIGAFSGAWNVYTTGFYDRVRTAAAKPAARLYIDSGDSGTASDNYWLTFNLRDALLSKASPNRWTLESDLRHVVGFYQQHNEAAWAARLPAALTYLFPALEEDSPVKPLASGNIFKAPAEGALNIEDAYAMARTPRDVNLDQAANQEDVNALLAYWRQGETAKMRGGQ